MVYVLERIHERHPELTEADVRTAWEGAFACMPRAGGRPFEYVVVGADGRGRLVEMVGRRAGDDWLVWHALTPPTGKVLAELGI